MYDSNKKEISIKSPNLQKDGLEIVENFFTRKELYNLEKELEILFSAPSFNGSSGCVVNINNRKIKYKCINLPTIMVRSVNLLEKAIDIRLLIADSINKPYENIKLTALDIFEEKNSKPLFWHTDNRIGTFRAFVYLKGGQIDSGAFRYMLGTHHRDYYVEHKLNDLQVEKLKNKTYIANGEPGTLVISNINGFHCNSPRLKTRRLIMLEYQLYGKDYSKSSIAIPSYWLTDKVKINLDMFDNNADINGYNHSQDGRLKTLDPSIDSFLYINSRLLKPWFLKQLRFWIYQFKKIYKILKR